MDCAETRQEVPLEIYTYICTLLFDSASEREALATLLSLLSTSRYIRTAASEPAIWKPYYDARYKNCVREREAQRREQFGGDYRLLYFARRELDRRGLRLLDDIRIQVRDRGVRAQELVKEFSFDVWDALGDEMRLPVPPYFREPGEEEEAPAVPHALSRKYWAEVAQGVIARSWAVKMWKAALQGDESVSFEDVMAGFSAFFGWSPMEISMRLDTECEICRRALKANGVLLDPEHPEFSVYDVCTAIICYMKEERWVKPADYNPGSEHYFLQFFPHGILVAGSRDAPFGVLANTWLFVSLCSRLGLDTYPSHIPPNELVCCVRSTPAGNPIVVAFRPLGEPRVLQGSDSEPHGEGSLSSAESTSYPPRPESSASAMTRS
ncbi:hypothetical protein C2E23DRAFT_157776 [Lenzites betulinus]|nr:hypothetical protein C2E23DRAFT_157776 [Lenzites betulinus]